MVKTGEYGQKESSGAGDRVEWDIMGATPASPLLFTALGSCAIGTGILSTPWDTHPPSLTHTRHFTLAVAPLTCH